MVILAVVAFGPNASFSGVGISCNRGMQIRLYPVISLLLLGVIQAKERVVSDDAVFSKFCTGWTKVSVALT